MEDTTQRRGYLFATCMIALIATSGGFIVRAMLLEDVWQGMFNLSETEKGQIFGAGLWPFAISIVLFSLVIDKIGYKTAMWFAVVCHIIQAFMLMTPGASFVPEEWRGYWWLWVGSFVGALGNGTIEAVINPVIATVYSKAKTKWLTILHAGWPGGLVLGGLLALWTKETDIAWQWQVAVILLPVVIYAFMLFAASFPVNERVAAGIPYMTMLRQAGVIGAFIVIGLILLELGRVFGWEPGSTQFWIIVLVMIYGFGIGGALGRGLFIILLFLMIPLATVELGTDSWIKALMGPVMQQFELDGIWVLIYTATIMMVMRIFVIGPLTKIWSPVAILALSSCFAAFGIYLLGSVEAAALILITATIYGIGQAFFWPCTLGLVSEQFPEGGALTINSIAGVGMLGVGIIGGPLLGNLQDTRINNSLSSNEAIYSTFMAEEAKDSVFGEYRSLNQDAVNAVSDRIDALQDRQMDTPDGFSDAEVTELALLGSQKEKLDGLTADAKAEALRFAALPAVVMAFCYLLIIFWFRDKGGYKPKEIGGE